MKIFILLLIFGVCKGKKDTIECDMVVPFNHDPHCGILPDCYQFGFNRHALEVYSCIHKQSELPDFSSIIKGECPTDKPSCPIL